MKKQHFPLTRAEKKTEWVLFSLFLVILMVIGWGLYNQYADGNLSRVLSAALFFFCGIFFILAGRNGLKKGNLISKWMPFLFKDAGMVALKKTEKDEALVKNTGIILIAVGIVMFILAIMNF